MQNIIRGVALLSCTFIFGFCKSSFAPGSNTSLKTRFYTMRMSSQVFNSVKPEEQISFSVTYNGRFLKKDVVTLECFAYNKTNHTNRKLEMDSIDEGVKFNCDGYFSTSILKQTDRTNLLNFFKTNGSIQTIIFRPDTLANYVGFIHYKISLEKANDSSVNSFTRSFLDPCPPVPCVISEN